MIVPIGVVVLAGVAALTVVVLLVVRLARARKRAGHCPTCGAPAEPEDRFCGSCSTPLR